jgi:hypothetical protein
VVKYWSNTPTGQAWRGRGPSLDFRPRTALRGLTPTAYPLTMAADARGRAGLSGVPGPPPPQPEPARCPGPAGHALVVPASRRSARRRGAHGRLAAQARRKACARSTKQAHTQPTRRADAGRPSRPVHESRDERVARWCWGARLLPDAAAVDPGPATDPSAGVRGRAGAARICATAERGGGERGGGGEIEREKERERAGQNSAD